jgi:hypothetical protein
LILDRDLHLCQLPFTPCSWCSNPLVLLFFMHWFICLPFVLVLKGIDHRNVLIDSFYTLQMLSTITAVDDLNYPEITETYYIVNAPYVFSACWKVSAHTWFNQCLTVKLHSRLHRYSKLIWVYVHSWAGCEAPFTRTNQKEDQSLIRPRKRRVIKGFFS